MSEPNKSTTVKPELPKLIKIAYSGTHGTGKTTAVYKRAHLEKLKCTNDRVRTLTETTQGCPFPINEDGTEVSQWWLFLAHMKLEIEAVAKGGVLICDRTVLDPVAYTVVHGYMADADTMFQVALPWMLTYSEIVVKQAKRNQYHFADGIRSESDAFRAEVEGAMMMLYEEVKAQFPKLRIIYD